MSITKPQSQKESVESPTARQPATSPALEQEFTAAKEGARKEADKERQKELARLRELARFD